MTKIRVTNVVTNRVNIARFSSIYALNRTDWEQTPIYVSLLYLYSFLVYFPPKNNWLIFKVAVVYLVS